MKNQKGFTLIELLVVVAIIGILATVVLASLGSARDRAKDARLKSQISGTRVQAELVADDNGGDYSTVCADPKLSDMISDLVSSVCNGATGGFTVYAPLVTDNTTFFCADATGFAGEVTTSPGTATTCE